MPTATRAPRPVDDPPEREEGQQRHTERAASAKFFPDAVHRAADRDGWQRAGDGERPDGGLDHDLAAVGLRVVPDWKMGNASGALRVFQDFFVDINAPVSLTQNDIVDIPVAVYEQLPPGGADGAPARRTGRLVTS